jgi:hypothetical protein
MSFPRFTFLGVLSFCVGAGVACSSGSMKTTSGATTGSGGSGGGSTSSGTGGVEDAGSDAPAEVYPGPFAAPPQVVDYGGPVLKNPKLVPVFFHGDDATFQGELEDFISKVGGTPYWTAAVGEYGVGAATALPPIQLTETAPATIDDTAIQTWLQGKLNTDDPMWPANDDDTVYVLHYPSGTTITLQGEASCTDFGGYHNDTQLDANHGAAYTAYAVVPRCTSFGTLMGIDAVSGAESHELAESCTDPYPQDNPAYVTVDNPHYYWARTLGGGEVGDMCAQFPTAFPKFAGFDYTVQRIWSNKQAKLGHDPCQPELPGEVYFNAAPVLDSVSVPGFGVMKGVKIAVGDSKTIDVDLFSDGDTGGPWTVEVSDFGQLMGMQPTLSLGLDRSSGQNGEIMHLTISPVAAGPQGGSIFVLMSSQNQYTNWWFGLVVN